MAVVYNLVSFVWRGEVLTDKFVMGHFPHERLNVPSNIPIRAEGMIHIHGLPKLFFSTGVLHALEELFGGPMVSEQGVAAVNPICSPGWRRFGVEIEGSQPVTLFQVLCKSFESWAQLEQQSWRSSFGMQDLPPHCKSGLEGTCFSFVMAIDTLAMSMSKVLTTCSSQVWFICGRMSSAMIWMTQPGVTLLRSDCEIDNILDGRIFMMQVVMLSQRWLVFVATKFQGRALASRTKRFSLTKELLTVLVNSRKDLGSKEKPPVLLSACLGMDFFSFHMLGRSFGLEQTCPYWRSVRESQLGTWSQPSRWASTWFGTVFQQGRTPQQRKHWRQRFWWGAPASRLGLIWVTVWIIVRQRIATAAERRVIHG